MASLALTHEVQRITEPTKPLEVFTSLLSVPHLFGWLCQGVLVTYKCQEWMMV